MKSLSFVLFLLLSVTTRGQTPALGGQGQPTTPTLQERVEVIATRTPEAPDLVPAPIEVILGTELRDRGATDLPSALALATGIEIAPGGDGGPAASVPEFWGLREFDAFLLVVDDVPWGGAFNPALATLSLVDVERIEILRGPAPVMYGATSFVGVIHVVHKRASSLERTASIRLGSHKTAGGAFATKLPFLAGWDSRLAVDAERQGFSDDRTAFARGHVLWRNSRPWGTGRFWFRADATWLNQSPASPTPREGPALSSRVPVDANHNPEGAFLDERRGAFSVGFERPASAASWTTTGSFSRSRTDVLRGFLLDISGRVADARGLRQQIDITDVYADSHLTWQLSEGLRFVTGGDFLHGGGEADGAAFSYRVPLDGSVSVPVAAPALDRRIEDRREFAGAYGLTEWHPAPRVRVDAGLRLNLTTETRDGNEERAASRSAQEQAQNNARLSGTLGVMWSLWEHQNDRVGLFASYRNTFKPAAVDFGIGETEGEGGPLQPETSHSYELGVKTRFFQGRLSAEAASFFMDFANLVIAQAVNGLPALANAGTERFKGLETSVAWYLPRHLSGRVSYSYHDARFRDFLTEFDGVPTQLSGKRLEMSAHHLASGGIFYAPPAGVIAGVEMNVTGSRFLNKRNTALADSYATVGASIGYRTSKWDVRLDARNLSNERPPVAESELGDAQYYRLPARRADVTLGVRF